MKKTMMILALLLISSAATLSAQDFSLPLKNGGSLHFYITDTLNCTVSIGPVKSLKEIMVEQPKGRLDIPDSVKYGDKIYTVTAIKDQTFADAKELTGVTIPSGITSIGARAFAGCVSLTGVVFPAAEPTFGKDVFAECTSLTSISFGSDWQVVDLSLFPESAPVSEIYIPAKVMRISNLKSLRALKAISVDANNHYFSSSDGLLYSGDAKTLYACPVAREGRVVVAEGAESILQGAFSGCRGITEVVLPQTMHEFPYNEFASCQELKRLELNSEIPPVTAKWNGSPVFALYHQSPDVKVYVADAAYTRYKSAICSEAGEYEAMSGQQKESFEGGQLAGGKSLVRIKKK